MGIIRNIKNIFITRSFIKKTIEEAYERNLKEMSKTLASAEAMINAKAEESWKKTSLLGRDIQAVGTFLQKYYGKQNLGNYTSHFVSYYYEAPSNVANLGDYIQTIATEMAIRKCFAKTEREVVFENVLRSELTDHSGGTCVMQGWYEHQRLTFLPGRDTRSVWIGTHLCEDARNMLKCLYECSNIRYYDIGCRDKSTMAFLQSLGTTAYFSRCLTLTLPRRDKEDSKNADTVYLVDCNDEIVSHLPANVKEGAKRISQRNFPFNDWMDWRQCREAAVSLLDEYRKHAKLIVTTALHCAQPCMAMGIPVVFIHPEYMEEDRFSSMSGLIHLHTLDDLKAGKVNFDINAPVFEDLKIALLRNLELSLKEQLMENEKQERMNIRAFIDQYNILDRYENRF